MEFGAGKVFRIDVLRPYKEEKMERDGYDSRRFLILRHVPNCKLYGAVSLENKSKATEIQSEVLVDLWY